MDIRSFFVSKIKMFVLGYLAIGLWFYHIITDQWLSKQLREMQRIETYVSNMSFSNISSHYLLNSVHDNGIVESIKERKIWNQFILETSDTKLVEGTYMFAYRTHPNWEEKMALAKGRFLHSWLFQMTGVGCLTIDSKQTVLTEHFLFCLIFPVRIQWFGRVLPEEKTILWYSTQADGPFGIHINNPKAAEKRRVHSWILQHQFHNIYVFQVAHKRLAYYRV